MSEQGRTVAIVTGGTRGIGLGIAYHLATLKFDLILGYNTNTTAAEETKESLEKEHGVKVTVPCNRVGNYSSLVGPNFGGPNFRRSKFFNGLDFRHKVLNFGSFVRRRFFARFMFFGIF